MQIQVNNLDGSLKSIEQREDFEDKQLLIDRAVDVSMSAPGFITLIGSNFDKASTAESVYVVAINGQLLWQNVLGE